MSIRSNRLVQFCDLQKWFKMYQTYEIFEYKIKCLQKWFNPMIKIFCFNSTLYNIPWENKCLSNSNIIAGLFSTCCCHQIFFHNILERNDVSDSSLSLKKTAQWFVWVEVIVFLFFKSCRCNYFLSAFWFGHSHNMCFISFIKPKDNLVSRSHVYDKGNLLNTLCSHMKVIKGQTGISL